MPVAAPIRSIQFCGATYWVSDRIFAVSVTDLPNRSGCVGSNAACSDRKLPIWVRSLMPSAVWALAFSSPMLNAAVPMVNAAIPAVAGEILPTRFAAPVPADLSAPVHFETTPVDAATADVDWVTPDPRARTSLEVTSITPEPRARAPEPMAGADRGRAYCQFPPMTTLDPTDVAAAAVDAPPPAAAARVAETVTRS